jgi:hypothetical protein
MTTSLSTQNDGRKESYKQKSTIDHTFNFFIVCSSIRLLSSDEHISAGSKPMDLFGADISTRLFIQASP